MATIIHNPYTTLSGSANSTIASSGTNVAYVSGGSLSTWKDESADIKEFVDFAFQMMGIDMDFDRFKSMTDAEKKAMIREQKINKIIE